MIIKKNKYLKQWLLIISYVLVFCLAFMGTTIFLQKYDISVTPKQGQPGQKGCTLEALLCPDGSAVGRSGPNCEFAKCPDAKVTPSKDSTQITTFEECAGAGYTVIGTYPRQCTTPDGTQFVEDINGTPQPTPAGL